MSESQEQTLFRLAEETLAQLYPKRDAALARGDKAMAAHLQGMIVQVLQAQNGEVAATERIREALEQAAREMGLPIQLTF
ncbi:MAG: hypothetical protein ABSG01_14265 [Anaerolineales bacterium]|jgi:predicted solute-binding protein